MTGEALKARLLKIEPTLSEVARKLKVSKQSLSQSLAVADIKTGLIERFAVIYDRPISYFFGESIKVDDHSSRDNSKSEHYEHSVIHKTQDSQLLERIKLLEEQLKSKDELLNCKEEAINLLIAESKSKQQMIDYLMQHK